MTRPPEPAADLLALLDDGRRRVPCPACGRLTCLTPLGLIHGHGKRTGPCRASWLAQDAAARLVRITRRGAS